MEIQFRFVDEATDHTVLTDFGGVYADYFSDDGYDKALCADDPAAADAILSATYIGKDTLGIGVAWNIWDGNRWHEGRTLANTAT